VITLERVEHGLVEIKKSVAPDYSNASWAHNNDPCIVIRLFYDLREPVRLDLVPDRERKLLSLMMKMNDAGVAWHNIIDSVLAMTGANAVIKAEPAQELEAACSH
jgi:hypothetical protein